MPPPLPRSRPAARAAHVPPHRRRRRPRSSPARSTTSRRPSAAAASTPTASCPASARSTSAPARELGPIDGADLVDWPVDYDELEPYYAEAERRRRRRRRRTRQPVRGVAVGPVPDAARPRHVLRRAHERSRDPARLPPVPRADRREQRRVRRPARVQQLRVLRLLRLPDRRQGRSGRAAAPRAAHRPLRDPARVVRHRGACSTRPAGRRAACATSTHDARRARGQRRPRGARRRRVRDAAAAAAHRDRQSRCRRPLPHVPLPDLRARHLPVPAARPPRPVRDAPAWTTRSSPTPPRPTRPRDAGLPYFRGGIVEHGGAGHPIMEAIHLPPGELHTQLMLDSPMRDRMAVFTMQGEDLPQATNRVDLDPRVRDVLGFPAGRVTYAPHRHEVACARALGAPPRGGHARGRRRDTRSGSRHLRIPGTESAAGSDPHADLAPRHGHAPHGRRPAHERVRPLAAAARRREHAVHRLVGVPDLDRLRADAHDRGPGDPGLSPR